MKPELWSDDSNVSDNIIPYIVKIYQTKFRLCAVTSQPVSVMDFMCVYPRTQVFFANPANYVQESSLFLLIIKLNNIYI